jgi:uncharacterized protein YvpB
MNTLLVRHLLRRLAIVYVALSASPSDARYLRDVPYFNQFLNDIEPFGSCQNTCMAMVLKHYGAASITPDAISRRWGTDRAKTVSGWQLVFNTEAQQYGLSVRDTGVSDGRPSSVYRQLDKGTPVVVHGRFTQGGHLIVLLGYDEDYFYVHDPAGDWLGLGSGPQAGKHARYSRQAVENALCDPISGYIRFHALTAEPGPLAISWEQAWPDSAVLGSRIDLEFAVRLDRRVAGGEAPRLWADLSGLGGPARVALKAMAGDQYRLEAPLVVETGETGWKTVAIQGEQAVGDQTHAASLTRDFAVLPATDKPLYTDGSEAGQEQWEPLLGAELNLRSTTQVYRGLAAMEVRATPVAADGGMTISAVGYRLEEPLSAVGYRVLRFAFHPGDARLIGDRKVGVMVNYDRRTLVWLTGGAEDLVDMAQRQWQTVEIPTRNFSFIEQPVETLQLAGELEGTFYLDEIGLTAEAPCPLAASWTIAPLDSVVAGSPYRIVAAVRIDHQADNGDRARLTADLSSLGGPAAVPLTPMDERTYRLEHTFDVGPDHGLKPLVVRLEQQAAGQTHILSLRRDICVLPAADLAIFADGWEANWTAQPALEVALDPAFRNQVYKGTAALAVQADNFTVEWVAAEPVERVGFRALRLAFHPGDAVIQARKGAFNITVNGDARTVVRLLGDDQQEGGFHLERREWQAVEIPLAAFGPLDGPLTSIRILGNLQGTFYLDDLCLVAARPSSPTTAVVEQPARPSGLALYPNYPNPFNSGTAIRFALERPGEVELTLFDLLGQQVARLARGWLPPGSHAVAWDGRDDRGRWLASGIYLCRLQAGGQLLSRKMVLLR